MAEPKAPPQSSRTPRMRVLGLLGPEPRTALDISALAGLSERQVLDQIPHIAKSLKARGAALTMVPASCAACGFVFAKRDRPAKPSSCPVCASTRIHPPAFALKDP